jgi:uncharacterized alkaline shock family protein YloU
VNGPTGPDYEPGHLLDADRLACGTDVDLLLEQVADGHASPLTEHQNGCVHCRAALGELATLWSPVHDLSAAPVPVPPGLTASVISRIRRIVRSAGYTQQVNEGGAIRIAVRVVAALARVSASGVAGVRLALGRTGGSTVITPAAPPPRGPDVVHTEAGALGGTAVVDLAVAVSYDRPVRDVAREIQYRVAIALRRDLGLHNVTVNVTVADIRDESGG